MKKTLLLILSALIFQSCGSGVSDRSVSTSASSGQDSDLSPAQIEALADVKIYEDLEAQGLSEYYDLAKNMYSTKTFNNLKSFDSVKCINSPYQSIVDKYKSYGSLVGEVASLLESLEEEYNLSYENDDLSVDEAVVLVSALEKIAEYHYIVSFVSSKCLAVKKSTVGGDVDDDNEPAPGPIGPPGKD